MNRLLPLSLALSFLQACATAAPKEPYPDSLSECQDAYDPVTGCTVLPATDGIDPVLLHPFPKRVVGTVREEGPLGPVFDERTGPEWSLANACRKTPEGYRLEPKELCAAVAKPCQEAYGTPTCRITDKPWRRQRFLSREVRATAFDKLRQSFLTLRDDPKVVADCCGAAPTDCERQACAARFKELRLGFYRLRRAGSRLLDLGDDPGTRDDGRYPYFAVEAEKTNHSIIFDEGMATAVTDRRQFEGFLLHEMAHACEASQWLAENQCKERKATLSVADQVRIADPLDKCLASAPIAEKHLAALLGPKTAACIKDRLAAFAATKPKNTFTNKAIDAICTGSWLQEAYADALSMRRFNTLAHWGRLCSEGIFNGTNKTHGPPRIAMECLFEDQDFVNQLCSQ